MKFVFKGTVAASNAAMVEIEKDEGGYVEIEARNTAIPGDIFNKMADSQINRVEVECERWDFKKGPMPADQGYNQRGVRVLSVKPL